MVGKSCEPFPDWTNFTGGEGMENMINWLLAPYASRLSEILRPNWGNRMAAAQGRFHYVVNRRERLGLVVLGLAMVWFVVFSYIANQIKLSQDAWAWAAVANTVGATVLVFINVWWHRRLLRGPWADIVNLRKELDGKNAAALLSVTFKTMPGWVFLFLHWTDGSSSSDRGLFLKEEKVVEALCGWLEEIEPFVIVSTRFDELPQVRMLEDIENTVTEDMACRLGVPPLDFGSGLFGQMLDVEEEVTAQAQTQFAHG